LVLIPPFEPTLQRQMQSLENARHDLLKFASFLKTFTTKPIGGKRWTRLAQLKHIAELEFQLRLLHQADVFALF
jgi:hypothetical protein